MKKLTIVLPVYNERDNIIPALKRIRDSVHCDFSLSVVYDSEEDNTLPMLDVAEKDLGISVERLRNRYGRGVLNAIKTGLESADSEYVIVTMADLCDPPEIMNDMLECAEREHADLVCASRYMKGGRQSGGPFLKGMMSRLAGLSLHWFAGLPTHDPTNSFKLYRSSFLKKTPIESKGGFELGIELVVKARKQGDKVCEVPTSWQDRAAGKSNFQLRKWLPQYLKWYFYAFNPFLPGKTPVPESSGKWQRITAWSLLGLAALWCFVNICRYAVNIPFWDEFDVLLSLQEFSLGNLFAQHNEHRIVFTRLVNYLFYWMDGLNLRTLLLANFLLYLAMTASWIAVFRPILKSFAWYPLLFLPFFADSMHVNFFWSAQNQFHFMLLFFAWALIFGFQRRRSYGNAIAFALCLSGSMFSMSPVFAGPLFVIYLIRQFFLRQEESAEERCSILPQTILAAGIFLTACVVFFMDGFSVRTSVPTLSPWTLSYWTALLYSSVKVCCGMPESMRSFRSLFPLLFYALPFLLVMRLLLIEFYRKRFTREICFLAAVFLPITAGFTVILAARNGGFDNRHYEIMLPLFPWIAAVLMLLPDKTLKKRVLFLYLTGMICSMLSLLSYQKAAVISAKRKDAMTELQKMIRQTPDGKLHSGILYPAEFSRQVKILKDLNLSCFRKDVP